MSSRRAVLVGILAAGSAALAQGPSVWATIENQKGYKQAYPGKDAKAYTCKACHQGAIGKKGDLNAYGQALQQSKGGEGKAKTLAVEDYRAIEQDDADTDGASNLDEITAGTGPGDPATKP